MCLDEGGGVGAEDVFRFGLGADLAVEEVGFYLADDGRGVGDGLHLLGVTVVVAVGRVEKLSGRSDEAWFRVRVDRLVVLREGGGAPSRWIGRLRNPLILELRSSRRFVGFRAYVLLPSQRQL